MDEYGGAGVNMFLTWHIFGDPSLLLRTKTPQPLTVQHDGVLVIGESTYAVTVPGVTGARCAIYGDGTLYGAAYTNAAGQATVTLDPVPDVPQTLGLTVTAYNGDPYFGQVEVISPSGAYLVYQGYGVEDASGGDGDGECDAGETVEISLTIRNVGQDVATGISGFLTTRDGFATIQVDEQQFPDIPAGESATSLGAYQVSFQPATPDGHGVGFSLEIDADQGMWTRSFSIPVGRPDLAYASHVVDDSGPGGNGTGWVGPGEAVNVLLTLGNGGHANACNVTVTLQPDTNIVILYGTATCPDIPAGGEAELTPMSIRLEDGCPLPSILTLNADVAADYGYGGTVEIQFPVGGFPDDCEVNRGWTCGVPDDNATTGRWVLADPVGTTYNGYIIQPEDDHTPAPGVQCYVTGNGQPGGAAGDQDLDGGKTTLLSPVFDLHAVVGATVEYWVWYTNDRGNNPGQDYWTVQVTGDGDNWIDLEHTTLSTNDWVRRFFVLQDHLPLTDHVQLRFVADDSGANSLVEALIDDFVLTVEEPTVAVPVAAAPGAFSLGRIAPNPASTSPEIRFSVPAATSVKLQIYDVSGRLVRSLLDAAVPSGEGRILWDRRTVSGHRAGAGMYYVRMEAPGFTKVRPVLLLE
jgi:hypothetical protein